MSTKKRTNTKNASRDDGPTQFFPKRGSDKRGGSTVPMLAGRREQRKAAKDSGKALVTARPATTKRRVSGLDAAAQVLAESRKAMTCQEIVAAMLKRGLWKTGGATPAATINAAFHREIKAKGRASRFWKSARGKFVVAPAAKKR